MRDLNYQLKQLCRHCREGSHATQAKRERMLTLIGNQLHELGYRGMTARSLKPKHIEALLGRWREQELTTGTIKNRMASIRWWANKVDKRNVVARSNEHYGIPDRRFVTNESKAKTVTHEQLEKVRDEHVRMSLELQQAFGLRREEAMKIRPMYRRPGRSPVPAGQLDQGRPGANRPDPHRTTAGSPRPRPPSRRSRLPDPEPTATTCSRCASTKATPEGQGYTTCTACAMPMPRLATRS